MNFGCKTYINSDEIQLKDSSWIVNFYSSGKLSSKSQWRRKLSNVLLSCGLHNFCNISNHRDNLELSGQTVSHSHIEFKYQYCEASQMSMGGEVIYSMCQLTTNVKSVSNWFTYTYRFVKLSPFIRKSPFYSDWYLMQWFTDHQSAKNNCGVQTIILNVTCLSSDLGSRNVFFFFNQDC